MKKILSAVLMFTMLFTMSNVFAGGGKSQAKRLVVGTTADYPPFEYQDENGDFYGLDIDLMNRIGERIGYEIEYVNMSFDKLINSVISGEVDCAISAITITEERERYVDFTIPYLSADVTYSDEEMEDTGIEIYGIAFRNNSAEKVNLMDGTGEESAYSLVNNALAELLEDKTVEKLGEKYNINKAIDMDGFDFEFTAMTAPKPDVEGDDHSDATLKAEDAVMPDVWARADVEKATALNIISGKYDYSAPITREEFCELIYNYCYNVIKEVDMVTGENRFTDTENPKIISLNAMGIIIGKSETKFAPAELLTREEAAVILERMVNKTAPVSVNSMYFTFEDETDISDWAKDSVQTMCNMGIMNGVGENKFAPGAVYTAEQAISTIVRIYEVQNANMGIIGSADAPTAIYISEDVEVSDFYISEALKHVEKAGSLAKTKEFISMYMDALAEGVNGLAETDFEKPVNMYYLAYDIDKTIEYYNKMIAEENPGAEIDIKRYLELNGFNLNVFATQMNGRFGPQILAATSVLTSREGYIMPKDFERDFGIYLQYEGDYSALVNFCKIGEGVIEARSQFVKNGDKNDVRMFLNEIYDALGKECLTIGKIREVDKKQ